ncbi:MAG: hypothetical protein FJY77_05025 [Candidatus Altiarchaeales archaeon]|nr:hypothetical protein [Candidatus Altiarchaeales archaeon]
MAITNPLDFLRQNPFLILIIIFMPIAVAIALFIIMKVIEMREERLKSKEWSEIQSAMDRELAQKQKEAQQMKAPEERMLPKPKSEKELTVDDLKAREERLRGREERLKKAKLTELEEKEKFVERKEVYGIVKEERRITDALEERRSRELMLEDMKNNRKRLVKLIELAEDRYKDGLMSEKNFRGIMNGYQKELIEVDIEMAKLRDTVFGM